MFTPLFLFSLYCFTKEMVYIKATDEKSAEMVTDEGIGYDVFEFVSLNFAVVLVSLSTFGYSLVLLDVLLLHGVEFCFHLLVHY